MDEIIKRLSREQLTELLRHAKNLMVSCVVKADSNAEKVGTIQTDEPGHNLNEGAAKPLTAYGRSFAASTCPSALTSRSASAASTNFNGCAWPCSRPSSRPVSARSTVRPLGQPLAGRIDDRPWWCGAAAHQQHRCSLASNRPPPESPRRQSRHSTGSAVIPKPAWSSKPNHSSCTEGMDPANLSDQYRGLAVPWPD